LNIGNKLFFVLGIVTIFLMMGVSLYQHELAHQFFNDKFGLKSEWFFAWDKIGIKTYGEQPEALKIMHGMNEAVSYNLAPLLSGIMLILFLGFWYLGEKIDVIFYEFKKEGITIQAIPAQKPIELDKTELI